MKRLLMSAAVVCVYASMAFAQQSQNTQSAESKNASAGTPDTSMNTDMNTNGGSKAQEKDKKKNHRKPQKNEDNRSQQEKDFDKVLMGIYGG
jgi:hypothetical protein